MLTEDKSIMRRTGGSYYIRPATVYVTPIAEKYRLEAAKGRLYAMSRDRELGEENMVPGEALQLAANVWAVYQPEAETHFEFFEAYHAGPR